MTQVRDAKLSELTPDAHNANKGTERGRYMLDHSLRQYGAGRAFEVLPQVNPEKGKTFIYLLIDPESFEIRYVGKANDPEQRVRCHYWKCHHRETHSQRWMASLKERDVYPLWVAIDVATEDDWRRKEKKWVEFFQEKGAPLTNLTKGGNGASLSASKATRDKMKQVCTGWHQTEEAKRRISEARMGMVFPEEHREALSKRKIEYFSDVRNTFGLSRFWAAISDDEVREVWRLANEGRITHREIAVQFGIPASTVSEIKHKKRYKHAFENVYDQSL